MMQDYQNPLRGIAVLILAAAVVQCGGLRRAAIDLVGGEPGYEAEGNPAELSPVFTDLDENRERIPVSFTEVAAGLTQITDIQFPPGARSLMFVLTKMGRLHVFELRSGESRVLLELKVTTTSEQGLLGLAFHPRYAQNGKLYLNYTLEKDGADISRVAEWVVADPAAASRIGNERLIMEVAQPYQNHNAGGLAFGPDGMLYIGWGDGGWAGDPEGNGQNPQTLLGSMLRIDVDRSEGGRAYAIPEDNPFPGDLAAPEAFAVGLRNPWRYSFDPRGRLIVADVGQNSFEEINVIEAGQNYGWNVREGFACFEPKENCADGFAPPIYQYGRTDGKSITGGFVYSGERIPALRGKYVFGDFITGRIWALEIPADGDRVPDGAVHALGKWPMLLSTFGQDRNGELYVGDFGAGKVYRLDPPR